MLPYRSDGGHLPAGLVRCVVSPEHAQFLITQTDHATCDLGHTRPHAQFLITAAQRQVVAKLSHLALPTVDHPRPDSPRGSTERGRSVMSCRRRSTAAVLGPQSPQTWCGPGSPEGESRHRWVGWGGSPGTWGRRGGRSSGVGPQSPQTGWSWFFRVVGVGSPGTTGVRAPGEREGGRASVLGPQSRVRGAPLRLSARDQTAPTTDPYVYNRQIVQPNTVLM